MTVDPILWKSYIYVCIKPTPVFVREQKNVLQPSQMKYFLRGNLRSGEQAHINLYFCAVWN